MMNYQIDSDTLIVDGDLDTFMDMTFEVELSQLLEAESDTLTVDLMLVGVITSQYIGQIVSFAQEAERRKTSVRVLATGKVGEVLRTAGMQEFVELILH